MLDRQCPVCGEPLKATAPGTLRCSWCGHMVVVRAAPPARGQEEGVR